MATPQIMDLIHPRAPDFRFPGWTVIFGDFRWFHVVGLADGLEAHGLVNKTAVKNYKQHGIARVPDEWRSVYQNDHWGTIGDEQIDCAIHSLEAMRFDKACLAVLCAACAVEDQTGNSDALFERVRLFPAFFQVDGYDRSFYDGLVRRNAKLLTELKAVTLQRSPAVFAEMADRHGVTYRTADGVQRCLWAHGHTDRIGEVDFIRTRKGYRKRPAPSERPIYVVE